MLPTDLSCKNSVKLRITFPLSRAGAIKKGRESSVRRNVYSRVKMVISGVILACSGNCVGGEAWLACAIA